MTMPDWFMSRAEIADVTPDFDGADLVLAFQPVMSAHTKTVAFTEALARLHLPNGQLVAPKRFLPRLERNGHVVQLDRLILRKVAAHMMRDPRGRFSVNISGRTLGDAAWLGTLRSIARYRPNIADRLIVEVTESALHDHEGACAYLSDVRRLGPAILLDDFGAGYTAIRQIRDFPLDGLKLDGGFTKGIDSNPDAQCLIRAMTMIARQFELLTIAEFVETQAEADCLARLGVDNMQGYFFARPNVPGLESVARSLAGA